MKRPTRDELAAIRARADVGPDPSLHERDRLLLLGEIEGLEQLNEVVRQNVKDEIELNRQLRELWNAELISVTTLRARLNIARSALRVIRGPGDAGRWIEAYRAAGGGYAGLQAIATSALEKIG